MSETPQNIYDDPEFLAGYSQLDRFGDGWQTAMEHADFLGLLPADVRGLRVLDLGCGGGRLAVDLAERGASSVLGVDVSERMLALARAHPRVEYRLWRQRWGRGQRNDLIQPCPTIPQIARPAIAPGSRLPAWQQCVRLHM
jgi:SAM-dependent methyltransferase